MANHVPVKGVSFAVSNSIPPYFYADKKSGLQYDLLKAALATQNLTISQLYFSPNKRAARQVQTHNVDCLINAHPNIEGLFYTQSLIEYQNSVFSLSENQFVINSIADLLTISLNGFQNATKYLGQEFRDMSRNNRQYNESNSQRSQVLMLFTGRVEAIVMERRIFEHYRKLLAHKIDTEQAISEHSLFAPAQRKIACFNDTLRMQIDEGISSLKQSDPIMRPSNLNS